MRPIGTHNYFVYVTTNRSKTVLYIGVTNDLSRRLEQHKITATEIANPSSFAGRYKAYYLVYYERYGYVNDAIDREKQLKRWSRVKKNALIEAFNPDWRFLNKEVAED